MNATTPPQGDLFRNSDPAEAARIRRALKTGTDLRVMLHAMPPFARGRPTSYAAAMALKGRAPNLRVAALAWIYMCGDHGSTYYELEQALQVRSPTASARCNELMRAGFIRDSGNTRPTITGQQATVWVATAAAEAIVHRKEAGT